jgi:hypothetical protein
MTAGYLESQPDCRQGGVHQRADQDRTKVPFLELRRQLEDVLVSAVVPSKRLPNGELCPVRTVERVKQRDRSYGSYFDFDRS